MDNQGDVQENQIAAMLEAQAWYLQSAQDYAQLSPPEFETGVLMSVKTLWMQVALEWKIPVEQLAQVDAALAQMEENLKNSVESAPIAECSWQQEEETNKKSRSRAKKPRVKSKF